MPSLNGSAVAAEVTPQPGYRALHWLLPLHVAPLAAVPLFYHGTAIWEPLLLAACVALSWWYVRRHPALGFGPRALTRLVAHEDGDWLLENAAGAQAHARLAPRSVVAGQVMVLTFRLANGKLRSRVLFGDEAGEEALRKLRAFVLRQRGAE